MTKLEQRQQLPAWLTNLFRKYLEEGNKPDWNTMLSYKVPEGFEQEDWNQLINFPDAQMIEILQEAGNVRITGYPTTSIKDIRNTHDKQALAVTGKIVALSDVEPDLDTLPYRCLGRHKDDVNRMCNHDNFIKDGKIPDECEECGGDVLEMEVSRAKNMQVYRLQDGNLMMSLVAKEDDLLYAVKPGHTTYGFGVLKFRWVKDNGVRRLKKYLELANIQNKSNSEVVVTPEDAERFNEDAKSAIHYQMLVESWAPHLIGLIEQKELCLIVVASKGINRPLNGFLGGPPATGKTELIIFSTRVTPNGQFVNTMNMTMAGLTSAAVTDPETGTLVTRVGMLAMADGDVAGITEFQAVKPNEKVGLNDVLERKEVAGSKADGTIKLSAKCAVLIDSNNYAGKWDYGLSLSENLKFLAPNVGAFLSRMDLISVTEPIRDKETIRAIAKANYHNSTDKEDPLENFMDDWEDENGIPHYGFNTLRKYIAYVTSLPLPPLDKEKDEEFADNYEEAHQSNRDFLVDGRYNRSIITIAKVRARLLLKPQVDEDDLREAMRMVNRSKDIETKTANGARDSGVLVGVKDKVKLNQEETFWDVVKQCTKTHTDYWQGKQQELEYASQSEIQYELVQTHKWPEGKARKYIQNMVKQGVLIEQYGQGKLTKV